MFFCQISHLGARETRRSGEAHAARRHASPRLTLKHETREEFERVLALVSLINSLTSGKNSAVHVSSKSFTSRSPRDDE